MENQLVSIQCSFPQSLVMIFENPSGFITKCYSFEGTGTLTEAASVFLCVCVVFFVSVYVEVCATVIMTKTQCVSESE